MTRCVTGRVLRSSCRTDRAVAIAAVDIKRGTRFVVKTIHLLYIERTATSYLVIASFVSFLFVPRFGVFSARV